MVYSDDEIKALIYEKRVKDKINLLVNSGLSDDEILTEIKKISEGSEKSRSKQLTTEDYLEAMNY